MFDGVTVAALRRELEQALTGARIQKVVQTESDELLLTLRPAPERGEGSLRLLLSANASLPLCYLTQQNKPAPAQAPAFCMLLRKHLQNGRIVAVEQPGLERILHLVVDHRNEMGDLVTHRLTIELMGKHSNILLTESEVVIDAIKRVSAMMSSVREVLPGRPYFIPETRGKEDPFAETREGFLEKFSAQSLPPEQFLQKKYQGLSSEMAEEVCYRAGISCENAEALSPEEKAALWEAFAKLLSDVREGYFSPAIYYDPDPAHFAAVDLTMLEDMEKRAFSSVSTMLATYYEERQSVSRNRQRSAELRKVVQTILERTVHKVDLQAKQLEDTKKKDKYRLYGELLQAYAHSLPAGEKTAEVENYHTGETVRIPMDETLSPRENAARYFDKYTHAKRTEEALRPLLEEGERQIRQLREIRMALDMAASEDDLREIREELAAGGYVRRKKTEQKGKAKTPEGKPLHYVTSDGYELFVGKNNTQNDRLTFHLALPTDLWFHANDLPGSHVILRTGGRGLAEIPDRVFEEAAQAAAYYSAGREQGKVEIDYCFRKELKKPPGAAPGFVIYHTNYSIRARAVLDGLTLLADPSK